MAQAMVRLGVFLVILLMLVAAEAATSHPKPKKVKCQDKKFYKCYHKDLYCPASCPRTCVVDCKKCKPVCKPPPPPPPPPLPPPPRRRHPPPPPKYYHRSPPPPPKAYPSPPHPPSVVPTPPPSTTTPPPPPTSIPSSPPPPASTPSPPPPSTSTPPSSYPPPPPSSETSGEKRKCKNKNYPHCYGLEHTCPSACPEQCEVDCVTCSPVCNCNRPGAVCQDPRFIGGDGITFYFHGKKDQDFCIVSDSNLHINAHFIGKRNQNMKRDFTWVQSLGIRFGNHKLFIGAKTTSIWDYSNDRLSLSIDGEPINLLDSEGANWQSILSPGTLSIIRTKSTNSIEIEAEGNFKIKAVVVPITEKDSMIHKYGVTQEDCFAHLDLSFKFYALSGEVNGVLGQTYASNYVSRVKMGVVMPVLGGDKEFASSSIFASDCAVSRFSGEFVKNNSSESFEYMNCASGKDGRGVVCKR
ncbi:unnamed protein product [Prunus brigantina]